MSLWIVNPVWFHLRSAFLRSCFTSLMSIEYQGEDCLMGIFLDVSGACLLIMSVIDDVNWSIRPSRSDEVSRKQAARSSLNKMLLILLYLLNVAILLSGGCFWMSKSQCIAAWSDMNDDVHTEWRNVDSRGVITRSNVWPLVCVGLVTCWAKLRLAERNLRRFAFVPLAYSNDYWNRRLSCNYYR